MEETSRPASGSGGVATETPGFGPKYGAADYQPPAPPAPAGPMVAVRTNTLAIVAFVLSLVSIALPGIVCGIIAHRQIGRSAGAQKGSGLATAAIVIGGLWILLILVIVATSSGGGGDYYSTY